MGIFRFFKIVQMVPNRATPHICYQKQLKQVQVGRMSSNLQVGKKT